MISWIQLTFQRHFRTVFLVLLAGLIISFIFTIGATPGIGRGDRKVQARTFFDLNLSSPEDQSRINTDANLSLYLQAGYQNFSADQVQQFAFERYAALYLANQLNLPKPSDAQLAEFIQGIRAFAGEDGKFDASAYTSFRDNLKAGGQFRESDVKRILEDDYRIRRVQTLLGGPGYVDASEVAFQLTRSDTTWTADIARIDYASFAPVIEPTNDQLQTYFEANTFRYDTPEQIKVSYVEFPATRYLAQVNPTDDEIRAYYDANPARFPKPAAAADAATPAVGSDNLDADFLAVRDQVSAALRFERARRMANEAASDLPVALFNAKVAPESVPAYLAAHNEPLRSAEPFSRGNVPAFLAGSRQAVQQAFALDADHRISDAIATAAGAVVLVWEQTIAPAPSPFSAVVEKVRADYIEAQKRERFVALGRSLRSQLQTALAAGKSFADAAAALTGTNGAVVKTVNFADFSRRQPPQDFPNAAIGSLEALSAGQLSEMVISGNEGLITYAAAKTVPAADSSNPRYAELRDQLASYNGATTAAGTLRALVAKELGLTNRVSGAE